MKAPIALFLAGSLAALSAFAAPNAGGGADRQRQFRPGPGGFRGNERSERPGRFGPGSASYGGNGCPDGTMRVAFAPDNLSFTILYDRFVADTSTGQGGRMARMSCDSVIPITIPEGQQMEITRVDYRGFVGLPQGARASLQSVFNFVGPGPGNSGIRNPRGGWADRDRIHLSYKFAGPLTEDYLISSGDMTNGRGVAQTEVSPCGGDAQLRIHNYVTVLSAQGQQASITIDSIDGSANAIYFVNWRSCQARPQPGGPSGPPRRSFGGGSWR